MSHFPDDKKVENDNNHLGGPMPEFLYRFRPVDRLIGKNSNTGELENHYIYFASPQQLNDPMEGYKDVFWKGDRVVWHNLFSHFFLCLIIRSDQYLSNIDFSELDFPIDADITGFNTEIIEDIKQASEAFTSNNNVLRHIDLLCNQERKIRRDELTSHLKSVQPLAVKLITQLMIKFGTLPNDHIMGTIDDARLLKTSTILINHYESMKLAGNEPTDEFFKAVIRGDMANQLIHAYKDWHDTGNARWTRLAVEFPSEYTTNLSRLCYSEWYTACFMSTCSNSSIWGTYGNEHKGVCLKFKANKVQDRKALALNIPAGFDRNGTIWRETHLPFNKIEYQDAYPELDFFQMLGALTAPQVMNNWYRSSDGLLSTCATEMLNNETSWRDKYWKNHTKSLTTKMSDWAGENEYRIIIYGGMIDFTEPNARYMKYRFDDLDGIIFGINTPIVEKFELIKIIEKMCDEKKRENFSFYQAYYDEISSTVQYSKIINISFNSKNLQNTTRSALNTNNTNKKFSNDNLSS